VLTACEYRVGLTQLRIRLASSGGHPLLQPAPFEMLLTTLRLGIPAEHSKHVAAFVAEVLGGPKAYSGALGGHPSGHLIRLLGSKLNLARQEAIARHVTHFPASATPARVRR